MILTSPALAALPGVRHAFFTREGGASEGPFASLNLGERGGDDPARVARNRELAAAALGLPADRLVTARQVHGTRTLRVEGPRPPGEGAPEADALATAVPGLLLGVLSADCAPVLLADPGAGAIAAAHAGWRGALAGVLESALAAMAALGASPARTVAAIGPCIGRASYEVGPEFRDRFLAEDPPAAAFFAAAPAGGGRPRFDLPGYCRSRLLRAGVGTVEALAHDTCAESARFFSHRRASRATGDRRFGLQLSAVALAG